MITIIIYIPIYILIKEKAHYAMYNVQDDKGGVLFSNDVHPFWKTLA